MRLSFLLEKKQECHIGTRMRKRVSNRTYFINDKLDNDNKRQQNGMHWEKNVIEQDWIHTSRVNFEIFGLEF